MPTSRNLITDVPGLGVGHAQDARLASGVTTVLFDAPAVAAVVSPGGAPGTRDTACLEPEMTVEAIDAIVLSGGSAFGLDAAGGVQAWLRERGRGFAVRSARVPIVAQAICFDLLNGGDKDWGRFAPYRDLGYAACEAAGQDFALGTAGGGYGATTANLKGGIGSASSLTPSGHRVGALAVVNAIGSAVVGDGPHFWAAPWEVGHEFGGLGAKPVLGSQDHILRRKGDPAASPTASDATPGTTIAIVATDARLTPAQTKRLAIMATAGLARALQVTFAPLDGDTVFAAATGRRAVAEGPGTLTEIGACAAACLARAIARGVYEARALPLPGALASWQEIHARAEL